jgi:hypothetical protein
MHNIDYDILLVEDSSRKDIKDALWQSSATTQGVNIFSMILNVARFASGRPCAKFVRFILLIRANYSPADEGYAVQTPDHDGDCKKHNYEIDATTIVLECNGLRQQARPFEEQEHNTSAYVPLRNVMMRGRDLSGNSNNMHSTWYIVIICFGVVRHSVQKRCSDRIWYRSVCG